MAQLHFFVVCIKRLSIAPKAVFVTLLCNENKDALLNISALVTNLGSYTTSELVQVFHDYP